MLLVDEYWDAGIEAWDQQSAPEPGNVVRDTNPPVIPNRYFSVKLETRGTTPAADDRQELVRTVPLPVWHKAVAGLPLPTVKSIRALKTPIRYRFAVAPHPTLPDGWAYMIAYVLHEEGGSDHHVSPALRVRLEPTVVTVQYSVDAKFSLGTAADQYTGRTWYEVFFSSTAYQPATNAWHEIYMDVDFGNLVLLGIGLDGFHTVLNEPLQDGFNSGEVSLLRVGVATASAQKQGVTIGRVQVERLAAVL